MKSSAILNMRLNIKLVTIAVALTAAVGCNNVKWQETDYDGFTIITQKKGATIGYSKSSGIAILYDKGYAFKDLNRNGELDIYEDWRRPAIERAQDLAKQLSLDEIAGLMLYSKHQPINTEEITPVQKKFLMEDNLRAVLVTKVKDTKTASRWNNNLQAFVEGLNHGIPANNSSDPRNETAVTAEYNAGSAGNISKWPAPLGLGATFDPQLVREFGGIASKEYRALGIATALSPQVDLATDPRWYRCIGTFSEDPQLATDMAQAYVDGFQTTDGAEGGWGSESVNAMVKHWPGGGPGESGRDAHYNFGKYAVYPGGGFNTHLQPFTEGAFNLKEGTGTASAVMPYYTISTGIDPSGKNVGNAFSKYIITDLLREKYRYEGVVCTDWGVTGNNNSIEEMTGKGWGLEVLSEAERHFEVLKAGCDQFGGNNNKGPVLEAYKMWCEQFGQENARARFERSAVRLLLNSFRTGLFENPYLNPDKSDEIVGNEEFVKAGYLAQLKSVVMLKNRNSVLPKSEKLKVYVPIRYYPAYVGRFGSAGKHEEYWAYPFEKELVEKYYEWVDKPEDADFALMMIQEPFCGIGYSVPDRESGGNGYVPMSLQYRDYTAEYARETSLAGGDPKESFTNRSYKGKTIKTDNADDLRNVIETKAAMGEKPVVVVVATTRPFVMSEFEPYADAILLTLGVQNPVVMDIVSGRYEPSGLLPVQMPANMKTVEEQAEDLPHDMECHIDTEGNAYDFAFGLNWSGIINDTRVQKYKKQSVTPTK